MPSSRTPKGLPHDDDRLDDDVVVIDVGEIDEIDEIDEVDDGRSTTCVEADVD